VNDNQFLAELFAVVFRQYGARASVERFAFQHGACVDSYLGGMTTWLFVRDSNFAHMAWSLRKILRYPKLPPMSVVARIIDNWPDGLLWDGVADRSAIEPAHGSVFPGARP
jgi:hypothetical protein